MYMGLHREMKEFIARLTYRRFSLIIHVILKG